MKEITHTSQDEPDPAAVKLTFPAMSLITVLLAATCGGCASAGSNAGASDYVIREMNSSTIFPAFAPLNADEYVAWLDDRRVVFEGFERKSDRKKSSAHSDRGLFVWEIPTGRISRHTKLPLKSSMCFADGFISYTVERDGTSRFMSGRFGEEVEQSVEQRVGKSKTHFNRFTCEHYQADALPAPRFGGAVYPLRRQDGWIERVRGGGWIITAGASPKKLVVPSLSEGSIYPHKYSNYRKAYLFFHSNRSMSETWAFSPSGQIQMLRFPDGPWGSGHVEEVRDGLVLRSKKVGEKTLWDPGHAGLYLSRPTRSTQKILSGNVFAMAVSADGCRIAALTDPWNAPERKHRLFAIDLCKKE